MAIQREWIKSPDRADGGFFIEFDDRYQTHIHIFNRSDPVPTCTRCGIDVRATGLSKN